MVVERPIGEETSEQLEFIPNMWMRCRCIGNDRPRNPAD